MEDEEETEKILKVILKADETSSLESLEDFIKSLSEAKTKKIFIISKSVGNLTEADIKNAAVFKAIIVAFKSKKDKAALSLAKSQNVKIIESEIIYELEKKINEFLEAEDKKDISGKRTVKILKTFGTAEGKKQIIGGIVEKGFVKNQESFEVWNEEEKLGEGKIINLQSQKKDVKEATENAEVGLLVESDVLIKENLKLVFD
jgi:translation initiation factor IF-2